MTAYWFVLACEFLAVAYVLVGLGTLLWLLWDWDEKRDHPPDAQTLVPKLLFYALMIVCCLTIWPFFWGGKGASK